MTHSWNELHLPFREALINALDAHSLNALITYRYPVSLKRISSPTKNLQEQVDDVLAHAVGAGHLRELAAGALATMPSHGELKRLVPLILAGIDETGPEYYQPDAQLQEITAAFQNLRPYLTWMQRRAARLPLGPLDQSGRDSQLIGLQDVFVTLDVDRSGTILDDDGRPTFYHAALGHLHNQAQLVLLGDPGSGKSTILRYLTLILCRARLDPDVDLQKSLTWSLYSEERKENDRDNYPQNKPVSTHSWKLPAFVPIFIQLRDFARQHFDPCDGRALWDFVGSQLPAEIRDSHSSLETLALGNQLYFMFDGIDEVPPAERRRVWTAIGAFLDSPLGGNRWVATCRTLSFVETELPHRHIPVFTLQGLNQKQIEQFISSWYEALQRRGELTAAESAHMIRALQEAAREQLQELAQNPMLLTIMAIVQTYEGMLPEERALLYQRCVETLLLRWQRDKDKDDQNMPTILQQLGTTQAQLEQLLWQLGWEAHIRDKDDETEAQSNSPADLPEWDVLKIARQQLGSLKKAEQFLHYTEKKAHLLVGRGGGEEQYFTFPHRTFQEYLAACYLETERRPLRKIRQLAETGDPWREVINLAFGRLIHVKNDRIKAIDILVEKLIDEQPPQTESDWRRIWIAGEAAAVVGSAVLQEDEAGEEILPLIRQQLAALVDTGALTPIQRAAAGDALGRLGDPRPGVCTLEPLLHFIPAGPFVYQNNEEIISSPFYIARYPVTVAQFTTFIADGGYEAPRFWHGENSAGWRWRLRDHNAEWRGQEPISQPEYWQRARWHLPNRPVVGVSWYEAQAYCVWLSEKTGRQYRLPTEMEWERAARHTDGRLYPWGNNWAEGMINSSELGLQRTTAAGCFPGSTAVCGAADMSGNVWEWTASYFDEKQEQIAVRGGSASFNKDYATVTSRNLRAPGYSGIGGFRVVSTEN